MQNKMNKLSVIWVRELSRTPLPHAEGVEESTLDGNIHGRMSVWEGPMAVSHICKAGSATQVTEEYMLFPWCAVCVLCLEVLKVE